MAKESNKIEMTRGEFKKEHQTLLKRLKHPTPAALKREARKQGTEMKRELGRGKGK